MPRTEAPDRPAGKPKVWVVEMLVGAHWRPIAADAGYRARALMLKHAAAYRGNNRDDAYRVVPYERAS